MLDLQGAPSFNKRFWLYEEKSKYKLYVLLHPDVSASMFYCV